jgi:outer membrane biosynthesis protein TonB
VFDQAALDAVRQWYYKPPVAPVLIQVVMRFDPEP